MLWQHCEVPTSLNFTSKNKGTEQHQPRSLIAISVYIPLYTFIYLFIYKISAINAVTKYLHAPFWYPDQPQQCLQNTASKGVTRNWILTLLSSIHRSIAPVNWYEFLQTMAFKTILDSANSYDLLSVSWSCQSTRRKKLLWKRSVWVVCLHFASVAGVNSSKFQERIYRRVMRPR